MAQTAAVLSALAGETASADAETVARRFKQGRRVAAKVETILAALARMGYVSADGRAPDARYRLTRGP